MCGHAFCHAKWTGIWLYEHDPQLCGHTFKCNLSLPYSNVICDCAVAHSVIAWLHIPSYQTECDLWLHGIPHGVE